MDKRRADVGQPPQGLERTKPEWPSTKTRLSLAVARL